MVNFLVKSLAILSLAIGIFILLAAAIKRFNHRGMAAAGVVYLLGSAFGLYFLSFIPPIVAFLVAMGIRKFFGEPNYSNKTEGSKSNFHIWWETYQPLVGPTGEPMNYITVIERITDMTPQERVEYIKQKTESNLLWTVVNEGGRSIIKPGKHEGGVVAWWICAVPYTPEANEVIIDRR